MTRRHLLRHIDTFQIEQAIDRVEAGTSGEIRVSIAGFFRGDPRGLAERAFHRLGMNATRHRNGVLILVAPTRRRVVILGDRGIHDMVGESFWSGLAGDLARRFEHQEFTAGLIDIIGRVGQKLATHFPPDPGDNVNELPDTVEVV